MKTVILQLNARSMILTPVKKTGTRHVFGAPAVFGLPENLRDGKALASIHSLAVFASEKIRGTEFAGKPFLFCLDDSRVVTKEYRHLPAKQADLQKFARLEAETVLHDGVANYTVETQEYRRADAATGRLKSVLYAVPTALVKSIRQEFRPRGIKIQKIMPPVSGLIASCRTVLGITPGNPVYNGKTAAVIDAGREKLRIVLFNSGYPLYQGEFSSVWGDILEILHRDAALSYEDAEREMMRGGFLINGGSSFGIAVSASVGTLLETAVNEVIRNARVVLSSERLELDKIFFCGTVTSHPDFKKFIEDLTLEIPFENVGAACAGSKNGYAVEQQAAVAGYRAEDFFALNGLLLARDADTVDFLYEENERRGNRKISLLIMLVMTLAAAAVMSVEPVVHQAAQAQESADEVLLSSPKVGEVKAILSSQSALKSQIAALGRDKKALLSRKSDAAETLIQIEKGIAPFVTTIKSCNIDENTGKVSLTVTVPTLDDNNNLRKIVAKIGYFKVLVPFTASKNDSAESGSAGGYSCTAQLQIKDFKPPEGTVSGGGASK